MGNFRDRSPTPWDTRLFARGAVATIVAVVLSLLVTAASDEGNVLWLVRLGRTLPTLPAAAAIGTWLALAPARLRGEFLAFAASGVRPSRVRAPALLGAALVASVSALPVLLADVDARAFYPVASAHHTVVIDSAVFSDLTLGVSVDSAGALTRLPSDQVPPARTLPVGARVVALLATVFAAFALALLAATVERLRVGLAALVTLFFAALALASFQAAGAGLISVLAALLPPFALLGFGVLRYRGLDARTDLYVEPG